MKEKNKEMLVSNNILSYERKLIYEEITEKIYKELKLIDYQYEELIGYTDTVTVFEHEVEFEVTKAEVHDDDTEVIEYIITGVK